jgi:hypothetical protein
MTVARLGPDGLGFHRPGGSFLDRRDGLTLVRVPVAGR